MSAERQRGDDCLTTFLSGAVGLLVFGGLMVLLLSWVFDR
jgi:hypothetical protein